MGGTRRAHQRAQRSRSRRLRKVGRMTIATPLAPLAPLAPKPAFAAPPAPNRHPPKRPKSEGHPYTPGMFAPLLRPPEHLRPDEIRAVHFDVAGREIVVREESVHGEMPRRLLGPGSGPYYIDIKLADGDEISIEVRRYRASELADDELGKEPASSSSAGKLTRCSLFDFGP